jgi:uroporphyrinogen-III synthase
MTGGGLPLIVTRPDPVGQATVDRARAMGLDARHLPLFAARAIAWTAPDPGDFDALLVTSAQAMRLAGPDLARLAGLPAYAVGAASAAAAEAAGLRVAMAGSTDGRDLLAAMTSQGIERILWLCGRERTALTVTDAQLTPLPCYAADPIDPPPILTDLIAAPAVLMAHSARGARRIAELVGAARAHLSLVAISASVAAAAGEGWAVMAIADRPDDAAMLAQAHALCHKVAK